MCNSLFRGLLGLVLTLVLAACARPEPVRPALWLVEGPQGQKAWLFGTIHALRKPVDWRSPAIAAALDQSDRLVLEVAAIDDDAGTARIFAAMAQDERPAPLGTRLPAPTLTAVTSEMVRSEIPPGSLDAYETWAAALMIAQAQAGASAQESANGIDRALAKGYSGPITELEGARMQLAIFDNLPEALQQALLLAVVKEGPNHGPAKVAELEQAWATGDLAKIAAVSDEATFTDPALREALLVGRNRAWTDKLIALLQGGARPFVGVGAAHLVGDDGLPAMLAARGYKVTRVQ